MTDAMVPDVILSEDDFAAIGSFGDALNLMADAHVEIVTTDDLGDGFVVVPTEDKARLVGVQFIIVNMRVHDGNQGEFVTLHIVTEPGEKLIVNDGSTGILAQCKRYIAAGRQRGIVCKRGLTRSDYDYLDDKGVKRPATTYYLG